MLVTNPYSAFAGGNGNSKQTSKFDWSDVMDAIIQVESNGNRHAKNGNQVGAMQITPILVKDCNQILKQRKVTRGIPFRIGSASRSPRKCSCSSSLGTTPITILRKPSVHGTGVPITVYGVPRNTLRKC